MAPTLPVLRPLKRPRLTDSGHGISSLGSPLKAIEPDIKHELGLTPSPIRRTLITSGVKRFAPLPPNCHPSCPQYKQNRKEWIEQCISQVEALSLKVERKLIRDDGLSIDWSSSVAVWSDTLKPEVVDLATAITEAHQTNALRRRPQLNKGSPLRSQVLSATSTPEPPASSPNRNDNASDDSPTKKRVPAPPRPSSMRRAIAARFNPSDTASSGIPPSQHCSPQHQSPVPHGEITIIEASVPTPSELPLKFTHESAIPEPETEAEREMLDATVNYLRRYIQMYDTDRASLASAYSRFASFSYRVHKMPGDEAPSAVTRASSKSPSPGPVIKRSRLDITSNLLSLPPLHSPANPNLTVAKLDYDLSYLGTRLGMFVVCRAVLPFRTVVHNFILQRKEADAEEAAAAGVWPLVANAHQIIVFEA